MPTAMLYEDRMERRRRIQILPSQLAAFFRFRIVILEADDPVARRAPSSPLANRLLNLGDGAQVAVHPAQVPYACIRGVRVRVDESGHNRFSADIDPARSAY